MVLVAACGGSSGGSSGGSNAPPGATMVTLSEFKFAPSSISVKAGSVTFSLVNSGTVSHDMLISDSTGKVLAKSSLISPGASAQLTVDGLAAGTYTFYCDVPGHRAQGMQGTLTAS
jgi:uncharacterized cupredoxin-like copper-binding protein